jgi:hypothetical protein
MSASFLYFSLAYSNKFNSVLLLPIAVKKGIEASKKAPLISMYRDACEQKESFSKLIEIVEQSAASAWTTHAGALRHALQRFREFVELIGRMSNESKSPGDVRLMKSMEAYFANCLREDLLPRFKRLQSQHDGVRASQEESAAQEQQQQQQQQKQQQQQHQDDEVHSDLGHFHIEVLDHAAEGNSANAVDEAHETPSSQEASMCATSPSSSLLTAGGAAVTASTALPKSKPPPNLPKADRAHLFNVFGKLSLPSTRASLATNYGTRMPGSWNLKNVQRRDIVDGEETARSQSATVQRAEESQITMPAYLELGALKIYADEFAACFDSEFQFTAQDFLYWCACDECSSPLQDPSHALAVGAAIVGQSFFEAVDAGSSSKNFDDSSDVLWHITGKWAGTPVQWARPTLAPQRYDDQPSSPPDQYSAPVSLLSSPGQRIEYSLSLTPSPPNASSSLDVS